MELLEMFTYFINKILSIKILGFELINHLIVLTIVITIFKIISIIGNAGNGNKRNKDSYEPKHAKK